MFLSITDLKVFGKRPKKAKVPSEADSLQGRHREFLERVECAAVKLFCCAPLERRTEMLSVAPD